MNAPELAPLPPRGSLEDLLLPGQAIRFQIDYTPTYRPSDLATDALLQLAGEVGLQPQMTASNRVPQKDQFSLPELLDLHRQLYEGNERTWRGSQGEVVVHILYVTDYADNATIAGFHTDSSGRPLIVLFMDRLNGTYAKVVTTSALQLSRPGLERAVLTHEFGHALGLVNCGLPQVVERHDDEHPCHSTDNNSTMYYAVHYADDLAKWILDDDLQPIWKFSADDWADIRAFQAQASTRAREVKPIEPPAGPAQALDRFRPPLAPVL